MELEISHAYHLSFYLGGSLIRTPLAFMRKYRNKEYSFINYGKMADHLIMLININFYWMTFYLFIMILFRWCLFIKNLKSKRISKRVWMVLICDVHRQPTNQQYSKIHIMITKRYSFQLCGFWNSHNRKVVIPSNSIRLFVFPHLLLYIYSYWSFSPFLFLCALFNQQNAFINKHLFVVDIITKLI